MRKITSIYGTQDAKLKLVAQKKMEREKEMEAFKASEQVGSADENSLLWLSLPVEVVVSAT